MTAVIAATGLYTPPNVITNEELVQAFNTYVLEYNRQHDADISAGRLEPLQPSSSSFIEKASGIKQRHVVIKEGILDPERMRPCIPMRSPEEPSLQCEMALAAIHQALDTAQVMPQEVDAIIVACSNFQRPYPAIAIEIAHFLKSNAFGFDMNLACSSATFGISTAANMINAHQAKTVVVVSPELASGQLNYKDRESHFIFGDACTAVVLQSDTIVKVPHFAILSTSLATNFSTNIYTRQGFLTYAETQTHAPVPQYFFQQNGRKVFKEVIPMVVEHLLEHFNQNQIDVGHIKRFWLHQANQNMNELITKKLFNNDPSVLQAPIILDRFANTGSAGSIICFHEYHEDFKAGELGIICSFGAGYSIGSLLVKKQD